MLTDITLGQYFPGHSIIHSMDPRIKLVLLFFYILVIFLFNTNGCYAAMSIFTLALVVMAKLPLGMVLKSIKPIMWIILFTFVIHLFSTPGESIVKLWILNMTWEGLYRGFFISLRLVLLIVSSSLLMFTTSPLMLTDALEDLFQSLKRFGFPAHELAMMMTIALRFIPTLIEETDKIMKAQQARGTDFTSGSIIKRGKQLIPILVPLFISAFRRADDLAMAMEARCYRGGVGRTRMKKLRIRHLDYYCICCFMIFVAVLGTLKFFDI